MSSWGLSSGLLSHAEATQARVRRDTETLTLRVSAICEMCIIPDREGHAAGLIALKCSRRQGKPSGRHLLQGTLQEAMQSHDSDKNYGTLGPLF